MTQRLTTLSPKTRMTVTQATFFLWGLPLPIHSRARLRCLRRESKTHEVGFVCNSSLYTLARGGCPQLVSAYPKTSLRKCLQRCHAVFRGRAVVLHCNRRRSCQYCLMSTVCTGILSRSMTNRGEHVPEKVAEHSLGGDRGVYATAGVARPPPRPALTAIADMSEHLMVYGGTPRRAVSSAPQPTLLSPSYTGSMAGRPAVRTPHASSGVGKRGREESTEEYGGQWRPQLGPGVTLGENPRDLSNFQAPRPFDRGYGDMEDVRHVGGLHPSYFGQAHSFSAPDGRYPPTSLTYPSLESLTAVSLAQPPEPYSAGPPRGAYGMPPHLQSMSYHDGRPVEPPRRQMPAYYPAPPPQLAGQFLPPSAHAVPYASYYAPPPPHMQYGVAASSFMSGVPPPWARYHQPHPSEYASAPPVARPPPTVSLPVAYDGPMTTFPMTTSSGQQGDVATPSNAALHTGEVPLSSEEPTPRRRLKCTLCGAFKKGHVCPVKYKIVEEK
jgi:hypothetical protein